MIDPRRKIEYRLHRRVASLLGMARTRGKLWMWLYAFPCQQLEFPACAEHGLKTSQRAHWNVKSRNHRWAVAQLEGQNQNSAVQSPCERWFKNLILVATHARPPRLKPVPNSIFWISSFLEPTRLLQGASQISFQETHAVSSA